MRKKGSLFKEHEFESALEWLKYCQVTDAFILSLLTNYRGGVVYSHWGNDTKKDSSRMKSNTETSLSSFPSMEN